MLYATSILALLCAGVVAESALGALPKSKETEDDDADTPSDGVKTAELGGEPSQPNLLHQIAETNLDESASAAAEEAEKMPFDDEMPTYIEESVEGWGTVTVVSNFEPGIDRLVLQFDAEDGPLPEVTLNMDVEAGSTAVMGDGLLMTIVRGTTDLSLGDLVISQTAAHHWSTDGGDDSDVLTARSEMTAELGAVAEAQTGSDGADLIATGNGDDAIFAGGGSDMVFAGDGADDIAGEAGDDILVAGSGDDLAAGGDGNDSVYGGGGDDNLFGGDGDDHLAGDAGDDVLQGGRGADTLSGGAGNDTLDGTYDLIDVIWGDDLDSGDTLDGGAGDDRILAGSGDEVTGGEGSDTVMAGARSGGTTPYFRDFDPEEDVIEVVYDPEQHASPTITVEPFEDGNGGNILLDGTLVLRVAGAQNLDPNEVRLIAQPS